MKFAESSLHFCSNVAPLGLVLAKVSYRLNELSVLDKISSVSNKSEILLQSLTKTLIEIQKASNAFNNSGYFFIAYGLLFTGITYEVTKSFRANDDLKQFLTNVIGNNILGLISLIGYYL